MPKSQQPQAQNRFLFLDGLRGLCAFMVILEHVPDNPVSQLFPTRQFGMCFFFLLSGFVMAHAYGDRLSNGLTAWQFTKRRFIRLYPLYLAGLAMGLLYSIYTLWRGWDPSSWSAVAIAAGFNVFMLPAPPVYGGALYPFNRPAWSLFFEFVASVLYACTHRFLTNRVLYAIIGVAAIGLIGTTQMAPASWSWQGFFYDTWLVIYGFFGGVLVHRWYEAGKLIRMPAWLGVVFALGCVAVPTNEITHYIYSVFGVLILMPCLLIFFARSPVQGLSARICFIGGFLSYGVYLFHMPIWMGLELVSARFDLDAFPNWIGLLILVVITSVVAALVTRFIDPPARRWLRSKLMKQEVQGPLPPPAGLSAKKGRLIGGRIRLRRSNTGKTALPESR